MKDIARLTLEEKVGQLFFVGFQGTEPDAEAAEILAHVRPGGLVFLQRNIESLYQIYNLNLRLQSEAGLPLFLAINHEGGALDRLKHVIAPIPSVAELADQGTTAVRSGARLIAAELEAAGFNMNLAPILDLGLAGSVVRERTMGASAPEVTRLGRVVLDEFHRKKILSCAGHFPGLGGAARDPHFTLSRVERSRRELLVEDVVPFDSLAAEVDLIMMSNGHYPGLGDLRPVPASLSKRVVDGLLRKTIGFEGVILTGDLTMGAVTSTGLTPATFLRAVEAGNDMCLFSQTTPLLRDAFDHIVSTARSDARIRARVDESVERILRRKKRIEVSTLRYRPHMKARLGRQIAKLRDSIPTVEKIHIH
jgi:beta-N-acetylhexosaminidase